MSLTDKQQRFVEEYLVDLNASAAARRAGYSESTAGSIGFENLQKPEIAAAITEGRNAQQERTEITADLVLRRLVEESSGETHSGRIRALELLGKHLAMFTDRRSDEFGGEPAQALTADEKIERLTALLEEAQ